MKKAVKIERFLLFILPILFFFINLFLIQSQLVRETDPTAPVRILIKQERIFYLIGLGGIPILLSCYRFKFVSLIRLAYIYFLYSFLSNLVEDALNINNESYKSWNWFEHIFSQRNFFPVLLWLVPAIAILTLIFRTLKIVSFRLNKIQLSSNVEFLFLSQILLSFLLTDSKFPQALYQTEWFMALNHKYSSELFTEHHFWLVTVIVAVFSLLATFISYHFVRGLSHLLKNRSSYSLAVATSMTAAVVFNYLIQMGLGKGTPFLEYYQLPGATSLQIVILFLIFLFLYLLINRYFLTTVILIGGMSLFVIANSIKFSMRGEPVLPSDMIWLSSPSTLLSFVDTSYMNEALKWLTILIIGFLILNYFLFKGKMIQKFSRRFVRLVCVFLCLIGIFQVFAQKENGKVKRNIPVITVLNNLQDITWLGNANNARYRSLAYVWINQLTTEVMAKPEGYKASKIKEIEEKYAKKAEEINQARTDNLKDHTVIYVLSESFADPRRIQGVTLTENPIPNIEEIKTKSTSGLMRSDGYGGGTANMEFQTLTGLPFYNISQSVSILYTEVFPKMNKTPVISDLYESKNRIALHLAGAANYSRNYIYNHLNYDRFITVETKGISYQKEGVSPSDASTYQIVLDNIKEGDNQFFSVMTMQNHSPWLEANPETMEGKGEGFTDEENSKLTFYSRLLFQTDVATKNFLDQLSKINKKITVVFYGAHLPGLYPTSIFKNQEENQYLTDYFVWSNYETPKLNYPLVNSSDFSALVMEQTNSKVSPYYALQTEVLHKASVDKSDLDAEAQEIANDMRMIEYDMVAGKGYLSKDFLKVPQ